MRVVTTALALALVAGATATPALAISVDPWEPSGSPRTALQDRVGIDATPLLRPWLAAGLTVAPALGLALVAGAAPAGSPLGAVSLLAPFTFGLGELYAGAGRRAIAVTLGGPIATLGGAGLGALAGGLMRDYGTLSTPLAVGAAGAATAYGIWAAADAFHQAQRENERDRPAPVIGPGDPRPGVPLQRPLGSP